MSTVDIIIRIACMVAGLAGGLAIGYVALLMIPLALALIIQAVGFALTVIFLPVMYLFAICIDFGGRIVKRIRPN